MAGPAEMQEFANVERQRQEAGPARVQEFVNIKHQLQMAGPAEMREFVHLERQRHKAGPAGTQEFHIRDSYGRRGNCISVNRVAETFQASPASEIWQQIRSGGLEGLVEGGVICFGEFPEAIGESRRLKSWWEERMVVCRKLSDLGGTERGNIPGVKSQSVLSLREAACEHAREIVEPENLTSYEFRIMSE
ncbi:hypothetical protein R3P38DRAFT_2790709 [Favolaschia claudopus]|uniref:Uncharacterized protein n=1 Tax=Favolaschia claudopus TaxID=2862362 RepID=A0AAW0AHH8_9AGAR